MKFGCSDMEQCFKSGELTPQAQEHLKDCEACRRELQLWMDLPLAAKELHCEWESPALWMNIKSRIEAENKSAGLWRSNWHVFAIAASVAVICALLFVRSYSALLHPVLQLPQTRSSGGSQDFLTEQALNEVEKNENAYVNSIQTLSRLAEPRLQHPSSPLNAAYAEKLAVLDDAIAETRAKLAHNQFNIRLRTELAGLYTEKQETLRELLTGEKAN